MRSRILHWLCKWTIKDEELKYCFLSHYFAMNRIDTHCPSLKYSLSVVLNFFEYFTNSFFRCSTACLPDVPGMNATTSFTASNNFLMALAISLQNMIILNENLFLDNWIWFHWTHLIVSKNVLRSLISSGIRLKIRLSEMDFLLSSWNASSLRFKRYSLTAKCKKKMV